MKPALSVVIPTRDRPDKLQETLAALDAQRDPRGGEIAFETLVVDDGSSRDPQPALEGFQGPIRLLRQPPSGPATARNRGVTEARADRVLFLGDDTRPAAGTLDRHLTLAARHGEVGLQGHIAWDPDRPITELMRFLAPEGPQFYFKGLEDERLVPYTAVLGSNFSAPTEWLRREPFDEGFPHAAMEDTEAAWRWQRRGWRTLYAEKAVCLHHHRYDALEPFLERQARAGLSARHAVKRHPRLLWPIVLRPTLFGAAVRLRGLAGRARRHDGWDLACRRAFLGGFLGFRSP